MSVRHGDANNVVDVSCVAAIIDPWRAIHDVADESASETRVEGHARHVWHDATGRDAIEPWRIAGLGHGKPLAAVGLDACRAAGTLMLDAGISSTRHIARFWGLLLARAEPVQRAAEVRPAAGAPAAAAREERSPAVERLGPGAIIENDLRTARLVR